MSDDELKRIAEELQNIAPSKASRKSGMDAAMSAFNMEFAADTVEDPIEDTAQDNAAENNFEKNSTPSQGLAAGPRLTGQTPHDEHVPTLGSRMMTKLNAIFTFEPKTAMLAGSCMAALLASGIYINMPAVGDNFEVAQAPAIAVDNKAEQAPEIDIQVADAHAAPVVAAPKAPAERQEVGVTAAKRQQSAPLAQPKSGQRISESRARIQKRDDISLGKSQQNILTPQPTQIKKPNQSKTGSPSATSQNGPSHTVANGLTLEEVPAQYKTETKTIITKEATRELVRTPPSFETVTETVVVQPPSIEYETTPPQYEWVDGEIEGSAIEYKTKQAEFETVSEATVVQEASTELVTIPATFNADGTIATPAQTQERVIPNVTRTKTRRVVKTPAQKIEHVVPYEIKDGKTRVPVKPAKVTERAVPAVTKQVSRRVIKTPASTQERFIPAGSEVKVAVRTEVSPEKFYLRDRAGIIVREFESRDAFEKYKLNLTTSVKETPVSTFSVDVDTASYSFFRASINRGQLPPPASVRLEEMINYFPYDYEAPKSADEPFKANVTVTPTPWNADTQLMHIGIKGYAPRAQDKPRSNIVFLIDTSGSMNAPNKLPLLINSFKLLLGTLDAEDTVSIVTYAGSTGTVLEPTPAHEKGQINAALNRLRSGGSTAGAAGLELAYQLAKESFDKKGNNRVILATDGDFNVGFSSPEEMKDFIAKKRKSGIFLSVLGFGQGNYNDHLMQALAQNGNGVAAYIDNLAEANKVLADEAGGALFTIAKDVKIQVEFNPETVAEYRLIGYETRALKRQDFNNDTVDAAEIGAGHTVTAIYEVTPVGSPAQKIDDLRYAAQEAGSKTAGPRTTRSDELAFVKIRHKLPNSDTSTLQTFPVGPKKERSLKRASKDMRFAAAVAALGQKLRGDSAVSDYSYDDIIELASGAKGKDKYGYRSEFIQLVRLAASLEN